LVKALLEIKRTLSKKISHQEKIVLLSELKGKNPRLGIIDEFISAEELLIKKDGLAAAQIYGRLANLLDIDWLLERQARTIAKYAYQDIGSGTLNKAHQIYVQLGVADDTAWKKIADILKTAKGYGYAAQCYLQAGKPQLAAKMCRKAGDLNRAALYFEKSSEWLSAAKLYKKAKVHDKAGECFKLAGDMKSAVIEWRKAGTLEKHNIGPQTAYNILHRK
jgi:tetratricopeptide (TPR) repeat protein